MKQLLVALTFLLAYASPAGATLIIFDDTWIGSYDLIQPYFQRGHRQLHRHIGLHLQLTRPELCRSIWHLTNTLNGAIRCA